MQGLITSSLFFSCALSLSLPVDTATSQHNKRQLDQLNQLDAGDQICESSSQVFTESDIQETALRACHLLHQQNLLDACQECAGVRPNFPQIFTGIVVDEVGHNLHHTQHKKTHAHPGSNYVQYVSIDHHNENDHESRHKHFNENEAYNHGSIEHKRPEHERYGHESSIHIKSKHGNPSHEKPEFHIPHHQHESDEVIFRFPIHGQKVIHDSARMVEPPTSILMTKTCVVVSIVETTRNGDYSKCKGRPLSSLMPLKTHDHSSHHKTSCVQKAC